MVFWPKLPVFDNGESYARRNKWKGIDRTLKAPDPPIRAPPHVPFLRGNFTSPMSDQTPAPGLALHPRLRGEWADHAHLKRTPTVCTNSCKREPRNALYVVLGITVSPVIDPRITTKAASGVPLCA